MQIILWLLRIQTITSLGNITGLMLMGSSAHSLVRTYTRRKMLKQTSLVCTSSCCLTVPIFIAFLRYTLVWKKRWPKRYLRFNFSLLNRKLMGLFRIWFVRCDYAAKKLKWQLLSKEIAVGKWRLARWGMWKINWPFNFPQFTKEWQGHALKKPLNHSKHEISQSSRYPMPVRIRVQLCRVQTAVCITGHKTNHVEFSTLTISLPFLARTNTHSLTSIQIRPMRSC